MLHTYLQKSGLEAEAELLYDFQNRLNLSQSKEEVGFNLYTIIFPLMLIIA